MDPIRFDRLTKLLGATASRRAALVAVLGSGLAGAFGLADTAANKGKKQRRKQRNARRGKNRDRNRKDGSVAAQATCASPEPSSNLSGCNFNDEDLAGVDLSSSSMRGTQFRRANLCGADLSSSQLKNADFRGADLTRTDLHSSGCRGTRFNGAVFCQTTTCNGSIRNDDCPDGIAPEDVCCFAADCGPGRTCAEGRCVPCDVCRAEEGCEYDSVEAAVAEEGAVIRICPGAYRTVDVRIEKGVTLIGAGTGSGGTVLDAAGIARVFRIQTDSANGPVRLENLTLTGGNASTSGENSGGAFRVSTDADVTLVGVVVTGNTASVGGGGILNSGALALEESQVTRNAAEDGGGIRNVGALTLRAGSRVSGNTAHRDGGGIDNDFDGTVTLQGGSQVSGNTAGDDAGGIDNFFDGTVTLETGSSVSGNSAASDGGGIRNLGTMTVGANCIVANNEAGSDGGGIRNDGTLTLEAGSIVSGNEADLEGGGIFNTVTLTLEAESRVTGNDAADGGGIFNNGGTVTNNGQVSGNAPNQCAGNPAVANCPN